MDKAPGYKMHIEIFLKKDVSQQVIS